MKNFKNINTVLRLLQIGVVILLTGMMVKAIRTLYILLQKEGVF